MANAELSPEAIECLRTDPELRERYDALQRDGERLPAEAAGVVEAIHGSMRKELNDARKDLAFAEEEHARNGRAAEDVQYHRQRVDALQRQLGERQADATVAVKRGNIARGLAAAGTAVLNRAAATASKPMSGKLRIPRVEVKVPAGDPFKLLAGTPPTRRDAQRQLKRPVFPPRAIAIEDALQSLEELKNRPLVSVSSYGGQFKARLALASVRHSDGSPESAQFLAVEDFTGVMLRAHWPLYVAAVTDEVNTVYDEADSLELTDEQRADRKVNLLRQVEDAGRLEAELVWRLRAAGHPAEFSEDLAPEWVLGIPKAPASTTKPAGPGRSLVLDVVDHR